jgi:hypothetical protein
VETLQVPTSLTSGNVWNSSHLSERVFDDPKLSPWSFFRTPTWDRMWICQKMCTIYIYVIKIYIYYYYIFNRNLHDFPSCWHVTKNDIYFADVGVFL